MSALRRIVALVGGCAVILGVQACSPDETSSGAGTSPSTAASSAAAPSASATSAAPAATATATADPAGTEVPLRGDRQVSFATVDSQGKSMLTVSGSGVLALTEEYTDRAAFVAVPTRPGADTFQLHTAKLRSGGESWCVRVTSGGKGDPLLLKIAACDAADRDQIFTFPASTESEGRLIEVAGLYAQQWDDTDKIVAQESGEGIGLTAFTVIDRGRATLPRLG